MQNQQKKKLLDKLINEEIDGVSEKLLVINIRDKEVIMRDVVEFIVYNFDKVIVDNVVIEASVADEEMVDIDDDVDVIIDDPVKVDNTVYDDIDVFNVVLVSV